MNSEHICTDCNFVKRLVFLCFQKGIKYKSIENLPRVLAMEFVNSGIVSLTAGAKETKEGLIENTRQKISRDIKNGSPLKVEFLDWYCRFFNCSADYLMGYIDTPTHEEKEIQELTDLNDGTVRTLLHKRPEVIDALNILLADIESYGNGDPDHIANVKLSLLRDLHSYLTDPGIITGVTTGFHDSIDAEGNVFLLGQYATIAGLDLDKLPLILMLSIQESLQDIRRYNQKRK